MKPRRFTRRADHWHPEANPGRYERSSIFVVSMASAAPPIYTWRSKYGGMDVSEVKQFSESDHEDSRRIKKSPAIAGLFCYE
ncbi:hypothetical protein KI811_17620 [Geobacter hydrogenophilus]|uniref:hypothetical protein n=1 Tax=Geobacter hydrogenophilus TaxID=40983 RepID=UPI001BD9953A|nr:hypothetical protein [Geobacter hydrogenophilus]MBT0895628.1 hypothetical protein [Geobacter hydrogenophilus]